MRDRKSKNGDQPLSESDHQFVERLRSELDFEPRSAAQRAGFRARLDDRVEAEASFAWKQFAWATTAAVAAMVLWAAVPIEWAGEGDRAAVPIASEGEGLLSYAYYETDYLADSAGEGQGDFLSDEYRAIADAFSVP